MAMFEQALSMWSPFGPMQPGKKAPGSPGSMEPQADKTPSPASKPNDELNELKSQLAAMQEKIEKLTEPK